MKANAIQPALRVLQSQQDIAPGEPLIVRRIGVSRQSLVNEAAFCRCEKLGGVRVVLDEPVCCHGDDHCSNAFLHVV